MVKEVKDPKEPIDFIKSERYHGMYRLVFRDGTISDDFYNKTRVKDAIINGGPIGFA